MTKVKLWLWLTLSKGISSGKITALFGKFDTIEDIYKAGKADYSGISGITLKDAEQLSDKNMKYAEKVIEECKRKGIRILTFESPLYPQNLMNIFDPPYVLYVRSKEKLDLNKHLCIAVVGNRENTEYGRIVTEDIVGKLAKEGVTIVSGMAKGIDAIAHASALQSGAKTIAVLGSGVDVCYPTENKNLMNAIIENGMVLSEFPPSMPPLKANFPQRNRIISGLSAATLVTEAGNPSGSLITASVALEQNREVYAVPGNITSKHSKGCNDLISTTGAKMVVDAEDILVDFRDCYSDVLESNIPINKEEKDGEEQEFISMNDKYKELSETEKLIVKSMSAVPIHIDALAEKTKLSAEELTSELTLLEISGMVKSYRGKMFSINI